MEVYMSITDDLILMGLGDADTDFDLDENQSEIGSLLEMTLNDDTLDSTTKAHITELLRQLNH